MKDFDAFLVKLDGKNLIEASAGTGKTFSIGILALRLIIENELNVNELLMVTFTKSAVEELKARINKFVRLAEKFTSTLLEGKIIEKIPEADIVLFEYLQGKYEDQNIDFEIIHKRLKSNLLILDEINIMTIHSFCQKTLNEFAFESKQLFGMELIQDTSSVLENEVNRFWRKNVATLDIDKLKHLNFSTLKEDMLTVVKNHLDGKKYIYFTDDLDYNEAFHATPWESLEMEINVKIKDAYNFIDNLLKNNELQDIINNASATKPTKKSFLDNLDNVESFVASCIDARGNYKNNGVTKAFPSDLWESIEYSNYNEEQKANEVSKIYRKNLFCWAIQTIGKAYGSFMISNNYMSYNDLITNLSKAISSDKLVEALQQKYKAVFVDEFQDTDKEQYNIFESAFGKKSILFMIGDPKQSIYGWRKADMQTYFKARQSVGENLYSMYKNFRSSPHLISDLNRFFQPNESFDTFDFAQEDSSHAIQYIQVESDSNKEKDGVYFSSQLEKGIDLFQAKNKDQILNKTSDFVYQLLSNKEYKIFEKEAFRNVQPSDIGIVVRSNKYGMKIKSSLAQLGIPTVMLFDEKVLTSDEAKTLFFILEAILQNNISNINKVLKTSVIGYSNEEILNANQEKLIWFFFELRKFWNEKGIYPTLKRFFLQFAIQERLQNQAAGERIWANITQIAEILNKVERTAKLQKEDLAAWLKRRIEGREESGDEFQMRIESDENAVKIITIHRSKGLEYNIVICPELDMDNSVKGNFTSFKNATVDDYVKKEVALLDESETLQIERENEREIRRLIYVALTRAKYKCVILSSGKTNTNNAIIYFYKNIQQPHFQIIDIEEVDLSLYGRYRAEKTSNKTIERIINPSKFVEENWRKLSYSAMAGHGLVLSKERSQEFENEYDKFIFSELKLGVLSGNLLHDILEKIDFKWDNNRQKAISISIKHYLPNAKEAFILHINTLIEHILNADIQIRNRHLKLNQISLDKRLSELEFDFPIRDFSQKRILEFVNSKRSILLKNNAIEDLSGIMNGKIDLVFELDGKFYILDWKSNYLGYTLEDYTAENLNEAMNEHNYHLQYLIYCVALKKYLSSRIPNFDFDTMFGGVIYMFLRGVREEQSTGVFTAFPRNSEITYLENILSPSIQTI